MQDDIQKKTVVLLEKRENSGDEVRGERACAEQADPDQGKAERGTGQAQHVDLQCDYAKGNGCAAALPDREHVPAQ